MPWNRHCPVEPSPASAWTFSGKNPPASDDPIFQLNVMATPHISGSTDLSMQGIVAGVVENILRIETGQTPLNCAQPYYNGP